jgi:hypothetical protein
MDLLNIDALSLSIATGIATAIILALKALFMLARKLAQKTPTDIDDKIIDKTEAALRDKSRNL